MADDGAVGSTGGHGGGGSSGGVHAAEAPMHAVPNATKKNETVSSTQEDNWSHHDDSSTPNPFSRRQTSMDLEDYFEGPRDMSRHSKWPLFLQMHGSILPKMIIPLLCVGGWATCITTLHMTLDNVNLGISSVLLTVTGFVVGLGLSFRTSTAYERYAEGRRFWAQLNLTCQSLGRVFWIHGQERPEHAKSDLLAKLTALNLLIAFAVSLKHKLRFEPYSYYEDLTDLIDHLDTYSKAATTENVFKPAKPGFFKNIGERLGLSFAASNPRKAVKKAQAPIGNLPLEILTYLAAYTDEIVSNGQLPIGMTQTHAYNGLQALNDVLSNTERVLTTPLPIAYTISISQITWVYVILLPFQLLPTLWWQTIPAAVAAAYIILGILFIGREVENPFGTDVNDLPLELYCAQIVNDIETLTSRPRPSMKDYVNHPRNKVLFPSSRAPFAVWESRPEPAIRVALSNRPYAQYDRAASRAATMVQRTKSNPEKKTTPTAESAV